MNDTLEEENDLLLLIQAHILSTEREHIHRSEIEAYMRVALSFSGNIAAARSVRTRVSTVLLQLRHKGLIEITEEGFRISGAGHRVVSSLQQQENHGRKIDVMQKVITIVHKVWDIQQAESDSVVPQRTEVPVDASATKTTVPQ